MIGFCRTLLCILVVSGITFAATDPTPKKQKSNTAKVTKQKAAAKQSASTESTAQSTSAKTNLAADTKPRFGLKKSAEYGVASRNEESDENDTSEDPSAAEAEAYQNRAYPAPYVPQQLTLNAQQGWTKIQANGVGRARTSRGRGRSPVRVTRSSPTS